MSGGVAAASLLGVVVFACAATVVPLVGVAFADAGVTENCGPVKQADDGTKIKVCAVFDNSVDDLEVAVTGYLDFTDYTGSQPLPHQTRTFLERKPGMASSNLPVPPPETSNKIDQNSGNMYYVTTQIGPATPGCYIAHFELESDGIGTVSQAFVVPDGSVCGP